jgi:hypothetical protein
LLKTIGPLPKSKKNVLRKQGIRSSLILTGQTKEGVSLPGMSGTDMNVELGSGQLIPGFEDQLTGKKVGDHVDVDVTFPEDYGVAELAGKPAISRLKSRNCAKRLRLRSMTNSPKSCALHL